MKTQETQYCRHGVSGFCAACSITAQETQFTPEISRSAGRLQWNGRTFYVVESGPQNTQLSATLGRSVLGPWVVVENNGDGGKPVVIREGISGTRANAIRVMEREVAAIAKATGGN